MDWLAPVAEKQGFILLRNWDYGFRNVTNSLRPINASEDVKGLKLRTPPELQIQASMEALGAVVQATAFPELYLALAQKVVDGQENPIAVIYYNKLYEVQKHLAITRHIYNNLWTSPAQGDLSGSAAGMHESDRPVAGRFTPLALMGVRCFWPHNMIGLEGLVVDQAWKFAVLADEPSGVTSHPNLASALTLARCDHAAADIVLLTREHSPGDPRGLLASATIARLKPRLAASPFSHWEWRSSCLVNRNMTARVP